MLLFISENKKILLVAISIAIASVSLALLLFDINLTSLQSDVLGGAEVEGEVVEVVEVALPDEDVRSLSETLELR